MAIRVTVTAIVFQKKIFQGFPEAIHALPGRSPENLYLDVYRVVTAAMVAPLFQTNHVFILADERCAECGVLRVDVFIQILAADSPECTGAANDRLGGHVQTLGLNLAQPLKLKGLLC
jgi:hypothetical protein